eukprot:g1767.t1
MESKSSQSSIRVRRRKKLRHELCDINSNESDGSPMNGLRQLLLEKEVDPVKTKRFASHLLLGLEVISTILVVLLYIEQTNPHISTSTKNLVKTSFLMQAMFFLLVFLYRTFTANTKCNYFPHSFNGVVDFFSVIIFFAASIMDYNFGIDSFNCTSFGALRLFCLLKLERTTGAFTTIGRVFHKKLFLLSLVIAFSLSFCVFLSALMYLAERKENEIEFSSFGNSLWWGIVTLTTVGYGDVSPVTPLGKFIGALTSFIGIGMFALPTGLISSEFLSEITEKERNRIFNLIKEMRYVVVNEVRNLDGNKAAFTKIDTNKDGYIDRLEWLEFCLETLGKVDASLLEKIHLEFDAIDGSENNLVNVDELKKAKTKDCDNDGLVDFFDHIIDSDHDNEEK